MSATGQMIYAVLVATGLSGAAMVQVIPHIPKPQMADYFVVNSVTAERSGQSAVLHVDREIKQPLLMGYAVRVFLVEDGSAWMICAANGGPYRYRPDAKIPDPVTLDWWTDGKCIDIPAGHVEIETTWDAVVPDFDPISVTTEVQQ